MCKGWFYFSVVGLTCSPEEMESKDFTCPRCTELEEIREKHQREVADLLNRLKELEEREGGWQLPKKTAKLIHASPCHDVVQAGGSNSFGVLQDDEGDGGSKEVVIVGSSNVRRIDRFIRRKGRSNIKVSSFSGTKTKDLQGKVSKLVSGANTKVFLHVGTNDTAREGSEKIINNLKVLIQEAKDANAEVAVCSIPSRQDNGVAFSRAEGINNRLSDICRSVGAEFVDLRGYLVSCRHWMGKDACITPKGVLRLLVSGWGN